MFFFFYIHSLPDKLPISPKIVSCDMILNLGADLEGGGMGCSPPLSTSLAPLRPPPRTAPAYEAMFFFLFFYVLSFYVFSSAGQLIGINYYWHISNIKYAFGPVHTDTQRESVLIVLGMKILLWGGKKAKSVGQ